MLHDSRPDQIVDADAALEFMKEATKLATGSELEDIGQRLERKAAVVQELLAEDAIGGLDEARFERLVGTMFSLRRKSKRLLRENGLDRIRDELRELLYGQPEVTARFDRFTDRVVGLEKAMIISLASESLHFNSPQRHWLWTHWIWNPGAGTGALALVTNQGTDLVAATDGEVYRKVGQAIALVNAHGHAVGYSRAGRALFGTDVFLACVYAVYMYTVFRVKLSQEFNRVLPELTELVQRVLGVRHIGDHDEP